MITIAKTQETALRRWQVVFVISFWVFFLLAISATYGQGSRKDDIVFGPGGRPIAGATVRVCQPTATGTPCSPLATIYTDATLTVTTANPFQADGLGNYHFYAPPGRYQIQISSAQISGTITQSDVILPADLSSSSAGNNISAFGLTLGGNLSVAGNATITGTLSSSSFNPGPLTSLSVNGNATFQGPRPYIDVTATNYGAVGDGGAETTTGSISAGSKALTVTTATGFKVGMGVHVDGAGASGDVLLATINSIAGSTLNLSVPASTTVSGAGVGDDDTLAIQAAIAGFCASGTAGGGSIYFPPGSYIYSQYQSVNPNAIPFNTCRQGIHFVGGDAYFQGTAFVRPPAATITAHCGPSPNAKAAFVANYPNGNATFENLIVNGCNQSIEAQGNVVHFKNVSLQVGVTGLADNTPLHVWDTFWVWFEGGSLITSSTTTIPALLMTGDACSGCYAGVGDFYMRDTLLAGGPISYIQRANQGGAPPGHWVFRNITQESGNGDLIQISNPGAFTLGSVGPITLDDVQQSDNIASNPALISFNSANSVLSGIYINNSGGQGPSAPAIKVVAGSLDHYFVTGCEVNCSYVVSNSSGNPLGSGVIQGSQGSDFITDITKDSSAGHLITSPVGTLNTSGDGPAVRITQSGSKYASYGIDALNGVELGSNSQAGWNAQIYQSSAPNIDIAFAANFPPTSVSATVSNSGGSFGTGTYYIYMVSTTTASCATANNFSAPSGIAGPYTVGAGVTMAKFNVSWTAAVPGSSSISGYCVLVGSAVQYNAANNASAFISGASTISATVTSVPNSPGAFPITYQMVGQHHFTPTGALFSNIATPATGNPPYTPACLAATTCLGFISESPFTADSFTRANSSTLGANWSNSVSIGGWANLTISSNAATAPSGPGKESWVAQMFLADQFARATINGFTDGASDLAGVVVRSTGTGTSTDTNYTFHCYNGSSVIAKYVNTVVTTLASGGPNCAVGNVLELDVVGGSTTYLTALINGSVALTATDSSSPITSGNPGVFVWGSSDSFTNWAGGSLAPGNGAQSIVDQPNVWAKPQTFASPITSASLAAPNKTRTCTIIRGDQSGAALSTANIQPQGSLCYIDAAATVTQVTVMVDSGASTVQVGYRHNGSTTAISPTLTPASVSGITDHVACANASGTATTIEGNSVTCSTLSNAALTLGDFIETIGGAADGTSKRMSVAVTYTVN
jgi:hypothetical protein